MNETGYIIATAIMVLVCCFVAVQTIRVLRRLQREERELLADKERWENQKAAELLALRAHPDDAQMWLQDESGEGAPYRIIAVGRN